MDGVVAYVLSKKYTKDTAIGMGAVKGAPCEVESVNKVGKTTTITLKWKDDLGVSHTQSFDIEDGLDGVSVENATINSTGHLIITLSDTTTIDCGQVLPQYDNMPTPSATYLGAIYQYIGDTNVNYTNGYYYKCVSDGSGGYIWVQYNVQPIPVTSVNNKTGDIILDANDVNAQEIIQYTVMPTADSTNVNKVYQYIGTTNLTYTNGYFYRCEYNSETTTYNWVVANQFVLADDVYTKTEIGALSDLPDTSKNVIQNISQIKLSVDQLQGSVLSALDGKEDKFRYTTMPTASSDYVGKTVQYIGNSTLNFTSGYYYQCVNNAGSYSWVQKNVQPSGGGTGGAGVVEGYYNSTDQLFYEDDTFINPISGENDTLYVSLDTNLLYRYDSDNSIFIRVDAAGQTIQVVTMPTPAIQEINKIYQYIGETSGEYTNGYFYKCVYDGSNYNWVLIEVQNSYTKEEIGDLDNLPDSSVDLVQNISEIKNTLDDVVDNQLTLGDAATNAYYGDKGKEAYDHSQITNGSNPHNTTANNVNLNQTITIGGSAKTQVEETLNALNSDKISKSNTDGLVKNDGTIDTNNYLTAADVADKADKVTDAITGDFATLDEHGNLVDSMKKPSDFIQKSNTAGLVKNDGTIDQTDYATVANLANKADKVSGATANNFAILDSNGNLADSDISKNIVPSNASSSNKLLVQSDIDSALSNVSENPVQNKVINTAIVGVQDDISTINDKITGLEHDLDDKQDKLIQGNGIDITDNNIALDISYLTASRLGFISSTEKGTNNGIAELDSTGKVPSSQLPSYVDDVVDGYYNTTDGKFYEDSTYTTEIVGQSGKIYISVDTDIQYRWTGSSFSALGGALQLGETSSTAYRGDRGKIAYDHSQLTSGNPHNVTATEVGLGNVANTGDSDTPVSGGTTKFTTGGAYTELNKKADKVASATNGNFAGLDANGNLTDSGKKPSDFATSASVEGKADLTDLASAFDDTTAYSVGDYVIYNQDVYRFTSYHSAGSWIGSDAVQVNVGDELKLKANKANVYLVTDTIVSSITNSHIIPFYNISTLEKRNITLRDLKTNFKTYFDNYYVNPSYVETYVQNNIKGTVGWTSRNLLEIPPSVESTTIEGVTFTVTRNSNGQVIEIDADGISTDEIEFTLRPLQTETIDGYSTYRAGLGENTAIGRSLGYYNHTTGMTAYVNSDNKSIPISTNQEVRIFLYIAQNQILGHVKFYPWIYGGEVTDATFEPYHKDVNNYLNDKYDINDTVVTTIDNDDKLPLYDVSATERKNITWTNIKSILKTYFDNYYVLQWTDL